MQRPVVMFWLVNRTSKRRMFAQGYAQMMATGMLALIVAPNWHGILVFDALAGLGSGTYSVVDLP